RDFAFWRLIRPGQLVDARQRRRFVRESSEEGVERLLVALDLDQDAAGVVAHEAAQLQARRQAEDEGTKPHALDDAFDRDRAALGNGNTSQGNSIHGRASLGTAGPTCMSISITRESAARSASSTT